MFLPFPEHSTLLTSDRGAQVPGHASYRLVCTTGRLPSSFPLRFSPAALCTLHAVRFPLRFRCALHIRTTASLAGPLFIPPASLLTAHRRRRLFRLQDCHTIPEEAYLHLPSHARPLPRRPPCSHPHSTLLLRTSQWLIANFDHHHHFTQSVSGTINMPHHPGSRHDSPAFPFRQLAVLGEFRNGK